MRSVTFFLRHPEQFVEKIVPLLPCRDHLLARNPFCLLTRGIRTLLAGNRKIRRDLGVCKHNVGCKPGTKAAPDVTLIYTFFFYSLSALFIRGASLFKADRAWTNFIHLTFIYVQIDNICKYKSTRKGRRGRNSSGVVGRMQTENCLEDETH